MQNLRNSLPRFSKQPVKLPPSQYGLSGVLTMLQGIVVALWRPWAASAVQFAAPMPDVVCPPSGSLPARRPLSIPGTTVKRIMGLNLMFHPYPSPPESMFPTMAWPP